ncbi:MAG: hypothetical protein IKR68_07545, partial [Lachnospiraceae bacterium]|nr:hypothetical protein [Lachnospiraceae bacterium]
MVLDGLPPVVIICLGDENEDSIAAYIESEFARMIRIVEERNLGDGAQLLGKDAFTATYRYISDI